MHRYWQKTIQLILTRWYWFAVSFVVLFVLLTTGWDYRRAQLALTVHDASITNCPPHKS